MQTNFSFQKTPIIPKKPIPALAELEQLWDKAMAFYDAGQYEQSVISVINYCDPGAIVKNSGNVKTFDLPHGSVTIHIVIDEKKISISCPFLSLPAEGEIALMRKVSEINSDVLGLSSIVLDDTHLEFRFETALELCYPHKLYDILWDICVNADYYDDEFVNEFKAVRLKEPMITPYEPALVKQAHDFYIQTLSECNEYISYYENKRLPAYAWDALSISLRKIDYYLQPKGYLGNMIRDIIRKLNNGNVSMQDRVAEGKKALVQLQSITADNLAADLYYADEFVSWKRYGKLEYIQQYFEGSYERATAEIKNGDYMACTCTIHLMYMNMFYYYRLTPEIQQFAEHNMMQASGKPWKEAAESLYASLDNFMEGNLLTAMSSNDFDMSSYMQQAMDMSKNMMAQFSNLFGKN